MPKVKGIVKLKDAIIMHIRVHKEVSENFKRLHSRWKAEQEDINKTTQNFFLVHLLNLIGKELDTKIEWKVKDFETA